jgi:hypothetical protein
VYPLPRADAIFDSLGKARWFSKLDMKSGYWQVAMDPADADKAAFVTPTGLYRPKRMMFGLVNAPATYQRLTQHILAKFLYKCAMGYVMGYTWTTT